MSGRSSRGVFGILTIRFYLAREEAALGLSFSVRHILKAPFLVASPLISIAGLLS